MTGLLIEVVRSTRNGSGFYGHIPIEPDYTWKCYYVTFGFHPKDFFEMGSSQLVSVRPQSVDFGSEQGLGDLEAGGIARYFEDFQRAKTSLWAERCRVDGQ